MFQLAVSYPHPTDPRHFLEYYRSTHVPLAQTLPGLRSFDWMVCESADEAPPPHFVVATLRWDSKDECLAALASPVGDQVIADLDNFADAGAQISLGQVRTAS